jgi:HSP20 family molecular chaperone IbpA
MDDLLVRTFGHTRLPQIILSDGFNFEPIVEIKNIGDKVLLFTAVPGYNAEDIQVKATANRVQITGERKTLTTAAGPQGETSRLDEVCRFSIVSILPAEVDPDKSKVMVHSGMLIVVIPKTEQAKAKMNIEAGK